ncbi:MAG: PatB family C-S lyase [Bacilli bacterium]|jgi:cystathionine beta-lyase|nr:PatB family C-S lyase [Bacilli bacterium]MDD3121117.1 PatB family C-S lyase [Bacilli bacterium]MDD4063388.1 PatB family C-S lyase [Bacilli bacterium]MDD4482367.1 PatB family C-S lyase [Bacilli bacterium]MDD5183430.1 PatB family C-S lyase [Bacilli bacterium]
MYSFDKKVNRINTNSIKWDLQSHQYGKDNLLPFGIADSDYESPKEVTKALLDRIKQGVFGYTFVSEEYRETVCKWHKRRYKYDISKDMIITVPKVLNGIATAIRQFTAENDDIIISPPVYPPFSNLIINNNRNLVPNRLINKDEVYTIDFNDLETHFKNGAKMYILCNPHNPVGRVFNKAEISKIINLCIKYDVFLVSDEIHCDLILEGHEFYSVGNFFGVYDKIIVCTAPSKTFNMAGLRCANIIIKNEKIRDEFLGYIENHSLKGANLLALTAAEAAYKCDYWVDAQSKHLLNNFNYAKDYLNKYAPRVKFANPEATYLIWLNFQFLGLKSVELIKELADFGIALNSGCDYCNDYDGYLRMNIACPIDQLKEGLKRIVNYLDSKK